MEWVEDHGVGVKEVLVIQDEADSRVFRTIERWNSAGAVKHLSEMPEYGERLSRLRELVEEDELAVGELVGWQW
jgi:quinol monooxygenase YgiN